MAQTPAKSREKPAASPESPSSEEFSAEVGRLVRRGRARRGITRRQLAQESGISERYLAQIESGQGNPSVIVLRAIAQAMELSMTDLLPSGGSRDQALHRIIELICRLPASEWPGISDMVEQRIVARAVSERGRRIALVGLRGAGKSTLGKLLAKQLGWPFVELNRVIEQEYGASISMLIELSGVRTFRRHERASLEKVIADHDKVVIATAGGIVSSTETYALLLRRTHAVWIKAQPQEHMSRVMAQGDFRPMAENREAMADLVAILEARSADYSQTEAELDTSGQTVEQSTAKLLRVVQGWTK